MTFSDNQPDRASSAGEWRFHAPLRSPATSGIQNDSGKRARQTPRYSRSLTKKMKELHDGDAARFQIGETCFMILRLGREFYVRPFGQNSEIRVNDKAVSELTRITFKDTLQAGDRRILLCRPSSSESIAAQSVDRLLEESSHRADSSSDPGGINPSLRDYQF